jgi:hypothetical protein
MKHNTGKKAKERQRSETNKTIQQTPDNKTEKQTDTKTAKANQPSNKEANHPSKQNALAEQPNKPGN